MQHELQGYLTQIEQIKADARALVAGLSDEQANRRPAPDKWCVAECLSHLNVAVTTTLPRIDRASSEGRAHGRTAAGPFRYGWFSRWMIASMEPPRLPLGAEFAFLLAHDRRHLWQARQVRDGLR